MGMQDRDWYLDLMHERKIEELMAVTKTEITRFSNNAPRIKAASLQKL